MFRQFILWAKCLIYLFLGPSLNSSVMPRESHYESIKCHFIFHSFIFLLFLWLCFPSFAWMDCDLSNVKRLNSTVLNWLLLPFPNFHLLQSFKLGFYFQPPHVCFVRYSIGKTANVRKNENSINWMPTVTDVRVYAACERGSARGRKEMRDFQ